MIINNFIKYTIKVFKFFFIVILIIGIINIIFLFKKNYVKIIKLNKILHSPTEVLGLNIENHLTIDFKNQISIGSPLVFGGVHAPSVHAQKEWDLLANVGITSIRRDFFLETEVPANITLEQYIHNENNVQDVRNWNWNNGWNNINVVNQSYKNAKARGMEVIGILSYVPSWLTYSGSVHGVPRDWNIYKDLVKKIYSLHREYIDYIEIWNEPTYANFLDISKSPYKTRADAYLEILRYATDAIKEVDNEIKDGKEISIIAIAGHTPFDTSILEKVLNSSVLSSIDAVSYHNYHIPEPSNIYYREVLERNKKSDLPIFLTEWNYSPDDKTVSPYHTSDLALTYTGRKLLGFLRQGLAGANYFSTNLNDPSKINNFRSAFGFYRVDKNNKLNSLPQGKTWKLLSKSLELGKGISLIFNSYGIGDMESIGFINVSNNKGIVVVNDTYENKVITVSLSDLSAKKNDYLEVYLASNDYSGDLTCVIDLDTNIKDKKIILDIPVHSIIGLIIKRPPSYINELINNLLGGTSTSASCPVLK